MTCNAYVQTVIFDIPLLFSEIDFFRKAVSAVVRKLRTPLLQAYVSPDLFYNHDDNNGKPINRYALVQYKTINGHAAISAMNQGASALQVLLQLLTLPYHKLYNKIHIHGRDATLSNYSMEPLQQYAVELVKEPLKYEILKWLPLEEERYQLWKGAVNPEKQKIILQEALLRQLSLLLKGAGYNREITYWAEITGLIETCWLKEFNVHKLAMNIRFDCNVSLPHEMGIGQVPSIGFGSIYPLIRKHPNQEN